MAFIHLTSDGQRQLHVPDSCVTVQESGCLVVTDPEAVPILFLALGGWFAVVADENHDAFLSTWGDSETNDGESS
jgi:hypothetical protein